MTRPISHEPLPPIRRLAITACLLTGCVFTLRALTPDVIATPATSAAATSHRPGHAPAAPGELSQPRLPADSATVSPTQPQFVTKNIEDIQPGDLVLARDEHGTEIGLKPVKEVYRRVSNHLRHLTFESSDGTQQTLSTTDEHPFWSVTAGEFLEAGSLPIGHQVTDPNGKTQTLVSSTREDFPAGIPVFNFQVEDFHTYYVAGTADNDVLLVHNADAVTYDMIRDAMAKSDLLPSQPAVSLPNVQEAVDKLLAGSKAPPIKVDAGVIVDGHHREIAGQIVGQIPERMEWILSSPARNWADLIISPNKW